MALNDQKRVRKQYTTDVNPIRYAYLNKPRPPFGEPNDPQQEASYQADMLITKEEHDRIEALCIEAFKEHCELNNMKMPNAKFLTMPVKEDENGEYKLVIKQKGFRFDRASGMKVPRTLLVVDSQGNPIDLKRVSIYSGTKCVADVSLTTFKGKDFVVTAYINAIQVVELVTGSGGGQTANFKPVEGGYVAGETPKAAPKPSGNRDVTEDSEDDEDADF